MCCAVVRLVAARGEEAARRVTSSSVEGWEAPASVCCRLLDSRQLAGLYLAPGRRWPSSLDLKEGQRQGCGDQQWRVDDSVDRLSRAGPGSEVVPGLRPGLRDRMAGAVRLSLSSWVSFSVNADAGKP